MIITSILIILSINCYVNSFDHKKCNSECLKICSSSFEINSKSYTSLCSNHCSKYNFEMSNDQVKCLLLCFNMKLDQNVCDAVCKPYSKFNLKLNNNMSKNLTISNKNGDGCTGNGRETCYKLCRLAHNGCKYD
jgi:hypothetical protein